MPQRVQTRHPLMRITILLAITCVAVFILLVTLSSREGQKIVAQEAEPQRVVITPLPSFSAEPTPLDEPAAGSVVRLQPTQKVHETVLFECEHKISRDYAMPVEWVNLSQEEFEDEYPAFSVTTFEQNRTLYVERSAYVYCPQHYVLMLYEDALGMYQTSADTLQPVLIQRIPFDLSVLDGETYSYLMRGIPFDSVVEMESFLEDLDS